MQDLEAPTLGVRGARRLTVCPCCGFKFEGDLRAGCQSCGARAVGEPLARPEHELPAYGRALLIGATGAVVSVVFLASTVGALFEGAPFSLSFWSIVAAAETAAWRLKWFALPATLVALWGGGLLYASIRRTPKRFAGLRIARHGLLASATVTLMIATFIGVTIPERLRQRQRGIDAGIYAQAYTINRALLEYRALTGTYPTEPKYLRILPDPNGTIAAALDALDPAGYKASSLQAFLPEKKPRSLRGAALRRISTNAELNDVPEEGFAFTNYELLLPGEDKVLGTADDVMIGDGVISRPTQSARHFPPTPSSPGNATGP